MRKTITVTEEVEREEEIVICDRCGLEADGPIRLFTMGEIGEAQTELKGAMTALHGPLEASRLVRRLTDPEAGYGWDVCDDCLEELLEMSEPND